MKAELSTRVAAAADTLRDQLNTEGVRVLSVFAGRAATPLQAQLHDAEGSADRPEHLLELEDSLGAVRGPLELPRTAKVTDLGIRPFLKS